MSRLLVFVLASLASADYDRPEGSPCTRDGVDGTCRDVRYCPSVSLVDLKSYDVTRPPICSFNGKQPIVCCTDCEMTDVTKAVVTLDGVQYKTGSRSRDNCLEYVAKLPYVCHIGVRFGVSKNLDKTRKCHNLFINKQYLLIGNLAKRGEFPHMGLVGYGEEGAVQWGCGGSVISDRFLLTAAHCARHHTLGEASQVALGILRRSDPADLWQTVRVRRFIAHPEYSPPSKYHDIALIETETVIKFSAAVLPICLLNRDLDPLSARAEGWGAEGFNKPNSDGLRQALLERFTDAECDELYPPHRLQLRGIDRRTQTCFGDHTDDKDTCQGDSGGPLQVYGNASCVEYVVGVTSFGRACGGRGGAGVYTRVWPYLGWVEDLVWPLQTKQGEK